MLELRSPLAHPTLRRDSAPAVHRASTLRRVSPGIILAVLFVAIGAQVTRLVAPGRGNYLIAVGCAALGLLVAELVALGGRGGPSLGAVHPVADALGITVAEVAGLALVAPPRMRRR